MSSAIIGLLGTFAALVLVIIRMPVAIAMGVVAICGIALVTNSSVALGIMRTVPFSLIGDWNLSAVPMFLLMGYIALSAGLTKGIFKAAQMFLQQIPGGLAISTVLGCAFFGAANGSSVATAATFSRIAIPEMIEAGYRRDLASGTVAAGGTLGALIPPSLLIIVYGLIMSVSINTLFIAAILPGLISTAIFISYIYIRVRLNPRIAPAHQIEYTALEKSSALKDAWPLPVIIIVVMGGIFAGVFTATEAGAIGAAVTCGIATLRGTLSWSLFRKALVETASGTAAIFIIVVGAAFFQRFLGISGVAESFGQLVTANFDSQLAVIMAIVILYLLMGCFLDGISILLLTLPILAPIMSSYGINEVWFCIIAIKLIEIGLMTPPVGMNIFVIKSALGEQVSTREVYAGAFGFVVIDLLTLSLLILFPSIVLWLPGVAG